MGRSNLCRESRPAGDSSEERVIVGIKEKYLGWGEPRQGGENARGHLVPTQPIGGGTIPGLVVLGSIRKQVEQAMESK